MVRLREITKRSLSNGLATGGDGEDGGFGRMQAAGYEVRAKVRVFGQGEGDRGKGVAC